VVVAAASATQYTYSNSGGSVNQTATTVTFTGLTMTSPAGTVTISCPVTLNYGSSGYYEQYFCSGGTFTLASSDGTTTINATFTSGTLSFNESGRPPYLTYYYYFNSQIEGTQTINGVSTAIIGQVNETLTPDAYSLGNPPYTGTVSSGVVDVSEQYEPVYVADTGNNRVVQMDDMFGSNWTTLGKAGSGSKQFSSPWSVALDSAGKIYVSDSGNCRIVRMDNITGLNWTSYGSCGSGVGQFTAPQGIALDTTGRIYVADSGNNRVVRINDLTGTGWTSLGTLGSGTNQFSAPAAVALDATGNIYVADTSNARLVEMSDISGTGWTTLQLALGYITPDGIAVDAGGHIYYSDSLQNYFDRIDNISGANGVYLSIDYSNYFYDVNKPAGLATDSDSAFYVADTNNNRVERWYDDTFNDIFSVGTVGLGTLNLSAPRGVAVRQPSKVGAVAAVAPASLSFPTEVVGAASPSQTATLTDIGTANFTVSHVTSSSADFPVTSNCPATLTPGTNCAASVTFQPTAGGTRKGTITFSDSGAKNKTVSVSGSGALVSVYPSGLILYSCASGTVTVSNPLSTATTLKSIKIAGSTFKQTNNCTTLNPGASCTVTITWCSSTPVVGTLTVTDADSVAQTVSITGEQ